jgi:hypothetical protein
MYYTSHATLRVVMIAAEYCVQNGDVITLSQASEACRFPPSHYTWPPTSLHKMECAAPPLTCPKLCIHEDSCECYDSPMNTAQTPSPWVQPEQISAHCCQFLVHYVEALQPGDTNHGDF